jgi:hypothetical protein
MSPLRPGGWEKKVVWPERRRWTREPERRVEANRGRFEPSKLVSENVANGRAAMRLARRQLG